MPLCARTAGKFPRSFGFYSKERRTFTCRVISFIDFFKNTGFSRLDPSFDHVTSPKPDVNKAHRNFNFQCKKQEKKLNFWKMSVGFIGAGRMAQALSRGFISKGKLIYFLWTSTHVFRYSPVSFIIRISWSSDSRRLDITGLVWSSNLLNTLKYRRKTKTYLNCVEFNV